MAQCQGCGEHIGDYSAYRHRAPGKAELVLCYRCKRWAERHPGQTKFPSRPAVPPGEGRRVRTFANIYLVSSFGLLAVGVFLVLEGARMAMGILFVLGALSLFLVGRGMKRFLK